MKSQRDKERMMHHCARRINAKADLVRDLMMSKTTPYKVVNDLLENALHLLYTNERMFDDYIEQYLYLIPTIDAYTIDPNAVEILLQHADYFKYFMSVPEEPIDDVVIEEPDKNQYFTVSEANLPQELPLDENSSVDEDVVCEDHGNAVVTDQQHVHIQEEADPYEVFRRTAELPNELQLMVTSYLNCAETFAMNIIADKLDLSIATEKCKNQRNEYDRIYEHNGPVRISNKYVLDDQKKEIGVKLPYCDGTYDVKEDEACYPPTRKGRLYKQGYDSYSLAAFRSNQYNVYREVNGCFCNSILYNNPWMYNSQVLNRLRRCGIRAKTRRMTKITVNRSASSLNNLAGLVKWKDPEKVFLLSAR